ncbi:hypothetical protein SAMN04487965_1994 [Microbulbifer donghaiensis]|uniref:Uncharacterized protein n=1 Tax=Microbulbifer donghaiensis TaxID=494016 RepID=A0A1M5AX67_9GAMM|nr:hypothetical protein [Microbulbifer donghaiensis]SHF34667.1 hypothetical protein SAMN04487965_1994 [Microbulbifer donghaiensis]
MDLSTHIIFSLISYKITSLVVGCVFAYMGYRLFMSGIWGHAGELETGFGDSRVVIKKAAPGTFFALFGAVIIAITLYKGLEFENYTSGNKSFVEIAEEGGNDLPARESL